MPLWVADFLADTMDLDAKEVGAYMLILMAMWSRDGYLPADQKKLQRVARVGRDWPKIWGALEAYFQTDGERIWNKRLLLEATKVAAKREVNSQSGARGGRAKALKQKEQALANATNSLYQPEPEEKREANASPKKVGKRLHDDWRLSRPLGAWAVEQGLSETEVRSEADRFRDYWIARPGKEGVKLDWDATWRNWVRKALDGKARAGPSQKANQLSKWEYIAKYGTSEGWRAAS